MTLWQLQTGESAMRSPRCDAARLRLLVLAVALSGCQATQPIDDSTVRGIEQTLQQAIDSQPQDIAPPSAVVNALLPSINVDAGPVDDVIEQRFDISVKEAPAQQFFLSLVDSTDFNMVIHPGVENTITLNLKNVTIPEVMEAVRDVFGYEFQRTRHGYEVLPVRLRSRIYQVNYLNMVRSGTSQTRVSSGQVSGSLGEIGQDDGSANSSTSSSNRAATVTGTEINTVQPATSFWQELASSVEAILGDAPGRSVVVSPQSGVVVVRAMPNELREVEEYLTTTQAIAQRQVILEAKIIEVELNDLYRQGINWAGTLGSNRNSLTIGQVGGSSIIDNGVALTQGGIGDLNPSALAPIAGTVAGAFGGMFTAALALNNFSTFIEFLDTQGTVHVLSSPRIATMNNQKAVIKVGSDEFFVTDISSTTTTGTTTTTTPTVELTPFFSGIALDVTPQISETGSVILHVHPAISEVVDQQKTITVGVETQSLPLAFSSVRESDSIVQALSGQVVVIGGLMQERFSDDVADSPLSSLDPSGALSHQRRTKRKSELVILLRPIVVESGQQWASAMRESINQVNAVTQAYASPTQ